MVICINKSRAFSYLVLSEITCQFLTGLWTLWPS